MVGRFFIARRQNVESRTRARHVWPITRNFYPTRSRLATKPPQGGGGWEGWKSREGRESPSHPSMVIVEGVRDWADAFACQCKRTCAKRGATTTIGERAELALATLVWESSQGSNESATPRPAEGFPPVLPSLRVSEPERESQLAASLRLIARDRQGRTALSSEPRKECERKGKESPGRGWKFILPPTLDSGVL